MFNLELNASNEQIKYINDYLKNNNTDINELVLNFLINHIQEMEDIKIIEKANEENMNKTGITLDEFARKYGLNE